MTKAEASKIYNDYAEFDEGFRKAKGLGDFKQAKIWKDKRDAIAKSFNEALRVLNNEMR